MPPGSAGFAWSEQRSILARLGTRSRRLLAACDPWRLLGDLDLRPYPRQAPEVKPLDPGLFPKDYKTEVVNFLRSSLTTRVKDAFIAEPVLKTLDKVPQYITCVRYTLRDDKNQSIGNETKLAVFLGGRLMQFLPEDPKLCAGLNYQRFPEIETMIP